MKLRAHIPIVVSLAATLYASGCFTDFAARSATDGGDATALDGAVDGGDASTLDAGPPDAGPPDAGPNCGNAEVDPGEQCDDGNASNNDDCTNWCANAECGDGYKWTDHEDCDDGNNDNTDACLNNCTTPTCGDSFVWAGVEECDDGNNSYDDGCLPGCVAATCGDGYIWQGHEGCDDHNTVAGDGCDPDCDTEAGWTCSGQPSNCTAVCGDGLIRDNEECDDGDTESGDGCSSSCTVEPRWQCTTDEPSVCDGICQDGQVRGTEQCDDGNNIEGDGCSPLCTLENLPVLRWRGSYSTWYSKVLTYADDTDAPTALEYPIRAAATVNEDELALIFTATTWHLLDLDGHVFVDHDDLATDFSGSSINFANLQAAQGVTGSNPADVFLFAGNYSYVFKYNYLSHSATFDSGPYYLPTHWSSVCCGSTIPNPLLFKAAYADLYNANNWTDPSVICGTGSHPEPHGLFLLTTGRVHLQDYGCGDTFYDDRDYSSYPAFSSSGAPAYSDILAAFFDRGRDRLYVITQP